MVNEDITHDNENVSYPYKPSTSDKQRTPCAVFELFVDVVAIYHLTKDTFKYSIHRCVHSFD